MENIKETSKKEKQNKKEEFKKRKKQIEESLQRLNTIKSKL